MQKLLGKWLAEKIEDKSGGYKKSYWFIEFTDLNIGTTFVRKTVTQELFMRDNRHCESRTRCDWYYYILDHVPHGITIQSIRGAYQVLADSCGDTPSHANWIHHSCNVIMRSDDAMVFDRWSDDYIFRRVGNSTLSSSSSHIEALGSMLKASLEETMSQETPVKYK